jgi:hypothetical protein
MNILKRLEKNKSFWHLLGISLVFFVLRLPSLIEPNWYGDEGIYQVIGKALSQGRLLYSQIWDNKPPLLYLTYALFKGDQFQVRFFSLIVGLISVWAFFTLSLILFKNYKASMLSTVVFAILFSLPLLEGNIANAENFMILPIIGGGILVYIFSEKKTLNTKYQILNTKYSIPILAGVLLGIAFLFKIVAVFDLAAFCVFLFISYLKPSGGTRSRIKNKPLSGWLIANLKSILPLIIGFLVPLTLTFLFFISQKALGDFTKAVFFSNVGYVGYGNKLIIPQGLLILKLILLALFSLVLLLKRNTLSKPEIFVLAWFSFSLFNTYFSGRPYTHYALTLLPSFCLLIGTLLTKSTKSRLPLFILLLLSILFVNNTFKFNIKRTISYYSNSVSFLTGHKSVNSYQTFFDHKTPRDYEIASFIKNHTGLKDNVFLWGDSAQIYALSDKLPPGRYTVAYHITQYANGIKETQHVIDKSSPKYIITLPESSPLPFYLHNYNSKFIVNEATIYERSF